MSRTRLSSLPCVSTYLRLLSCAALLAGCSNGSGADPDGWVVSTPEAEGMDSAVLEGARTYAFTSRKHTQGVVVVRHGRIAAEWYSENASVDSYAASWSMAKSFTSALIGIALSDGLIPSLDVSMADYLPSWKGTPKEAITLRDVMTMSSGLEWNESYTGSNLSDSDVAELVLTSGSHLAIVEDQPLANTPGSTFLYSSGDAMLLSAVLEQATGMQASEFAQARLFGPLGLEGVEWWRDAEGQTLTYCCLDMRSRDFARFGELYLHNGTWDGASIVPSDWVTASVAPSAAYEGYGYQWWLIGRTDPLLPDDTFAAEGHDGQYIYVVPSLDLVVVRNGIYHKSSAEPVATPDLFTNYPSGGIIGGRGTTPPDSWEHAAFLGPIIDSITAP